jgi:nitrite reductase/ring-hydroxylating ferredoxin subunit
MAPNHPVSRRAVIAAGASLALGAAAACGRPGTDPGATPAPTPGGCARAFARTSEVPVGGGRVFPEFRVVVTQPAPGEFRGFGIVCTHDGCELDSVADGTINCPCHGSRYSITDGSRVAGPARTGLRQETIAVEGGCIVLL